ncbi:ATP-binding cassette domain-containing protein [Actinomadura terrae]|uniref:ATP-binding cassette domain-containing protein n=1 Tax=Actinomadura terrae TaxID=604353 RepID=UPI001FA73D5B|nr:ATP-binding cassette domain-containing protein [Actinomadura terrae]
MARAGGSGPIDVRTKGLTVELAGRGARAVDHLTVSVGDGEQVALLGPAGSGKTTLLRAVLGAVAATGTLRVGGHDPRDRRARRATGFVRQGDDLVLGASARFNALMGTASGWRARDWTAAFAGRVPAPHAERLAELAETLGVTDCLLARAVDLSGGQRRRISLIRALLPRPRLLLADEPTHGLDPVAAGRTMEALRSAGATLIVSTRDLALTRHFSRVIALRKGRLVHDGSYLDDRTAAAIYGDGAPRLTRRAP